MAPFRLICLVGLGGLIQAHLDHAGDTLGWLVVFCAGGVGWSWAAVIAAAIGLRNRVRSWITGKPTNRSATDPSLLAEEIYALRTQVANLRDTATSYDLSLDEALQRIDERLKHVEHSGTPQSVRRVG